MNSYLLKECPPLRTIFVRHYLSKFIQTLFYTSMFAALLLLLLPIGEIYASFAFFARILLLPLLSLLQTAFQGTFYCNLFILLIVLVLLPTDSENYAMYFAAFYVLLRIISPHACAQNYVDFHYASRFSAVKRAVLETIQRALVVIVGLLFLKGMAPYYAIPFDYVILLVLIGNFNNSLYYQLLNEPVRQFTGDQLKLAIACTNVAIFLQLRADSNQRHYANQQLYKLQQQQNKKQGKMTPPIEVQTEELLSSRGDTFIINQLICSIQRQIQTLQPIQAQILVQPAVQLAEKLRSLLKYSSMQPVLGLFEAQSCFMSSDLFYLNFMFQAVMDAVVRIQQDRGKNAIFNLDNKLLSVFNAGTADTLQNALAQQQDGELDFDGSDNGEFGVDFNQPNDAEGSNARVVTVDNTGRSRVKLSAFQFIYLLVFSPLKFNQLVNDREAVDDYLEQKKKEKQYKQEENESKIGDILTLKFLRNGYQLQQSKVEDILVLRSVISGISDCIFTLRSSPYYFLCKDAAKQLLKTVYQSVSGRKSEENLRCACKTQAYLMKE